MRRPDVKAELVRALIALRLWDCDMMRSTKSKTELRSAEKSRRDRAFQRESVNEQEERANKTARLRGLRLAKEAADRELAKSQAAEKGAAEAEAKAKTPAKKARLIKRKSATEDRAAALPDADPAES